MPIVDYLERRARSAHLSPSEERSIHASIAALKAALAGWFGADLLDQFHIGPLRRGTLLPPSMDDRSGIDYAVVFAQPGSSPRSDLDRLQGFRDAHGRRRRGIATSTSVGVCWDDFGFNLIPARRTVRGSLQTPDSAWAWGEGERACGPTEAPDEKPGDARIRDTVRLAKFWNARAGHLFDAEGLENFIAGLGPRQGGNQRDDLFWVFDNLALGADAVPWCTDRLQRAKDVVARVRHYEQSGMRLSAEIEIRRLIPED